MKYRFLFFILFSIGIISGFRTDIEKLGDAAVDRYYIYKTRKDLLIIKTYLDREKQKNGLYPPVHRFSHWYKTTLSGQLAYNFPLDRWGQPYFYTTINKRMDFIVSSRGKDQRPDTIDDIKISSSK
ncbi:MAG: type II secretion system protein GspG [Desulfobacteraceae bacterium]